MASVKCRAQSLLFSVLFFFIKALHGLKNSEHSVVTFWSGAVLRGLLAK